MSAHLSERQIEGYRRRSLRPEELLEVDDHLADCGDCRRRVAAGERLAGAVAAWQDLGSDSGTAVGIDLGALMEESGRREERAAPPVLPRRALVMVLSALGLLLAAGLMAWFATLPLRREVASLRREVRTLRQREAVVTPPAPASGLAALPADLRDAVTTALRDGRLERPALLAGLLGSGAVLRGPADSPGFALQAPLATAVLDGRPVFRWSPLPGGESYRVMVFDRDFNPVTGSGETAGTQWTPDRPLPPGGTYAWQVKARGHGAEVTAPGPASPEARFLVLPAEQADAVRSAAGAAGSSPLALGVLYARAGLADDAERELAAAVREGPEPEAARRLLDSVRSWRRAPQSPRPTSTNAAQ